MANWQIVWTRGVEGDIGVIAQYMVLESVDRAKAVFEGIVQSVGRLRNFPVIYKFRGEAVYILMVLDGNRDIEDLLFLRLTR